MMNLDEIRASVEKRFGALTAEIEELRVENVELRKRVEQLASEPEPALAPFRDSSIAMPQIAPDAERPSFARGQP
jgi:cell division protein FtsB